MAEAAAFLEALAATSPRELANPATLRQLYAGIKDAGWCLAATEAGRYTRLFWSLNCSIVESAKHCRMVVLAAHNATALANERIVGD